MNVEFSKAFVKASKRLSGKMLDSLRRTIVEVKAAKGIQDISDCKKLVGYRNIYRIRLGDYRALFTLEIEFSGDTIFFQYNPLAKFTTAVTTDYLIFCKFLYIS